ncbi:DUF6191 domain-containing protein [Cellulosimicrobium marinum]|uniref:DUF6191 domain-containing protein n=1 Tax=Cellulosimicrobium marinum TaxID=1638992 RepID=UPI001E4F3535|nr:DUF6191 domain-containing protein [Cellulosimicrobium marinum]MCB7137930.1 DUF6191 domain-containing protein [Cellulosimicrobium marinum]
MVEAAGVFVTLVVLVLLVVGIERFTSGKEARARRAAEHGESAGSGMFGEIVEIFQPSRTHVTEEKERQRLDVVQRPAEGRPFDVDLDTGVFFVPGEGRTPSPGGDASAR